MRKLVALLAVLVLLVALATHFTGTCVDQQSGVTLVLQMQQDGTIQGTLTGPSGDFQLQGQGNEQGAFFQADQNNQRVQAGGLVLQPSGAARQPGMGQPGQMPGMTQPGMPVAEDELVPA